MKKILMFFSICLLSLIIFKTPSDVQNEQLKLDYIQSQNQDSFLLDGHIVLEEIGGQGAVIDNPIVDYQNKQIIFEVPLNEFPYEQNEASFLVREANISDKAILGAHIDDYSKQTGINYLNNLQLFKNILLSGTKPISDLAIPTLFINYESYKRINKKTNPLLVGEFTIYSQSFLESSDNSFDNTTTYKVYFILTPNVDFDNNRVQVREIILDDTKQNFNNNRSYYVNHTIGLIFRQNQGDLPHNYQMKYISLYYNGEEVDSIYYDLNVTPITQTNPNNHQYFQFTINLKEELIAGKYTIKYQYFRFSNLNQLDFYLNERESVKLLEVKENNKKLDIIDNIFYSQITFGKQLDLENIEWQLLEKEKPYLQTNIYQLNYLNIQIKVIGFLDDVSVKEIIFDQGLYYFSLEYQIKSYKKSIIYYHQINEKELAIENIYQNNLKVDENNIKVLREEETKIEIDFGIDQSLYQLSGPNHFTIIADFDNFPHGITYDCNKFLSINFSLESLPGNYRFTISYIRKNVIVKTFYLDIIKLKGKNAYLSNIVIDAYPEVKREIGVADENGNLIKSQFTPMFTTDYIDYRDAINEVFYFRINLYVINLRSDDYLPQLVDYLPLGATISKLDNGTWTKEIARDDDPASIELLKATPKEIITYRVTSEDKKTQVYYYLYLTDEIYNVEMVFHLYAVEEGVNLPAHQSQLFQKAILIKVNNVENVLESSEIIIKNTTNLFYIPYQYNEAYCAPNLSGYYFFDLEIADAYTFQIECDNFLLPDISENQEGKVFYIEPSLETRVYHFNIYIYEIDAIQSLWGLNDYYASWK